jgi:hypothetical protein
MATAFAQAANNSPYTMGQNTTPSPPQSYYPGNSSPQTPPSANQSPTFTSANCARRNSLFTHQHAFVPPSLRDPRISPAHVHLIRHRPVSKIASIAVTLASTWPQPQTSRRRNRTSISSARASAEQPVKVSMRNTARLLDRQLWHTGRYVDLF